MARRRFPVPCPDCGRRPLANALPVVELRRFGPGTLPRVVRVVQLGCRLCLLRRLWAGVGALLSAEAGPLVLLVLPLALFHAFRASLWSLLIWVIGPTIWLRRALEEAGIPWREFVAGPAAAEPRPPLDLPGRRELAAALAVLLRGMAAIDGASGRREWAAVRSYLRYFWADEPEVAAAADPGPEPLAPPGPAEIRAAAEVIRRLTGRGDARLILQMLLGIAEQEGGVSEAERSFLLEAARLCGLPEELAAEWIGLPPPESPPAADDPWRVLGLRPGASREEVRSRYLLLVRRNHPDRVAHLGPAFAAAANRRMAAINAAYRTLTRTGRSGRG